MKYHKLKKVLPDFRYEKSFWKRGYYVIGVDEVGRGALAGPLTVGAVCFNNIFLNSVNEIEKLGINDSKKLSAAKREILAKIIKSSALGHATVSINPAIINRVGIVKATQMAIRGSIKKLINKLANSVINRQRNSNYFLLLDAFYVKYIKNIGLKNQLAIVKGDQKSISIAAASIIAKVERDHTMIKLDHKYPIYLWKRNKGYGTKKHINAIKKFGKSTLHRDLFLRKIK